jgi:hypothetical protein
MDEEYVLSYESIFQLKELKDIFYFFLKEEYCENSLGFINQVEIVNGLMKNKEEEKEIQDKLTFILTQ